MSVLDKFAVILYNCSIMYSGVKLLKETRTGGRKEYWYSVIWTVLIMLVARLLIYLMPLYKLFGVIAAIAMFAVFGFYIITRYAAVFTYKLTGYTLYINRQIGGRKKEIELKISEMKKISDKKEGKFKRRNMYMMCATIFPFGKKRTYVQFGDDMLLIFEPSSEMAEKIKTLKRSLENG